MSRLYPGASGKLTLPGRGTVDAERRSEATP
jgi:hypothetical protein